MEPTLHLQPLALGDIGTTPWSFSPAWVVLLGLAPRGLSCVSLARQCALEEDPHRLRRSGIRELSRILTRVRRSGSSPQRLHLHGWCRATARAWGVQASAPTASEVTDSLHALTGDDKFTAAW